MTSITDALAPSIQAANSAWASLDFAALGGFSLLDIFLAFIFLALVMEFIMTLIDMDVDLVGAIFNGGSDEMEDTEDILFAWDFSELSDDFDYSSNLIADEED